MIERFSFDKDHRARTIFVIFNYTLLTVLCVVVLFPMLKVLIDSFDRSAAIIDFRLFPKEISIEAYMRILSQASLYRPFINSLIVTTTGTILALIVSGFMAYALTRKDLPGRKIMMTMLMITMVFRAGILPLFLVVKQLGLRNTLWAVILAHCIETYYLVLLRNFFETIPRSIEESAELDGASPISIFFKIVLPLSKPGLAAIGLFYVVLYWNQFFEYIIYMDTRELVNFQVALRDMVLVSDSSAVYGFDIAPEALKNAVIIVNIIPVLILYPLLQKHFVTGINLGAIKE